MGCGKSKDKSMTTSGQYNKDLKEPRTTIQKFPYDKILQPMELKDEILELCALEANVLGKGATGSSGDKSKYMKLREKIEDELNRQSKLMHDVEMYPADKRSKKIEDLQPFDFMDPFFSPNATSLFDPTMGRHQMADKWETFTWKRPTDVYGVGKFYMFKGMSPNDIKQGYLGDCYFLSAISSLAEYSERVNNIFTIKEVNTAGYYEVTLYVTGEKRTVFVDDYFPFNPGKNKFAFSQSVDNELWVLILEKAWAKAHGNYQRIEGGNTAEALMSLTGAYVDYVFHNQVSNKDALWKNIFTADQQRYIIATAASSAKTGKLAASLQAAGIIDAHAYSLLETNPIMTEDGKKIRLLKLRNPWGFEEWKGDWSDNDTKNWTDELKRRLNFESQDDGIFFIDFENYLEYYYNTTI